MRLGAFFPILGDGQRLDLAMKNGDFMGIYYDFMVKNGGIPWGFYGDFMGSWELMGYITKLLDEIGLHAQFSGDWM